MQHGHVLQKLNLAFWPQVQAEGGGGGYGQNIWYRVTAFAIAFNLICNMTMFWKSWILEFWPPGLGGVSAGILFATTLHVAAPVIPFNFICNLTMFWKSLILTFDPTP